MLKYNRSTLDSIETGNQIVLSISSLSFPNLNIDPWLLLAEYFSILSKNLAQSHPNNIIFRATDVSFSMYWSWKYRSFYRWKELINILLSSITLFLAILEWLYYRLIFFSDKNIAIIAVDRQSYFASFGGSKRILNRNWFLTLLYQRFTETRLRSSILLLFFKIELFRLVLLLPLILSVF